MEAAAAWPLDGCLFTDQDYRAASIFVSAVIHSDAGKGSLCIRGTCMRLLWSLILETSCLLVCFCFLETAQLVFIVQILFSVVPSQNVNF